MIKKEFYKFKEVYFLFALLACCFLIYLAFKLKNGINEFGAMGLNLTFFFQKGFSFYHITDLNLTIGLGVAIFVFLRERINARLRLSLHFPRSTWMNISYIIFTGFVFVVVLYMIEFLIFNLTFGRVYIDEILSVLNSSLIQSFTFGLVLYLFCAGLIIEPSKKRVVVNFIVMCACTYLYYDVNPDIYALKSFYENELGLLYIAISAVYATNSTVIAFDNYKQGYIK